MPAAPHTSYRDIADDLTDRIRRGEKGHQPGDMLPSLSELANLYSVSVSTAARAMGLLRDRGLTVGAQGKGVYVATPTGSD